MTTPQAQERSSAEPDVADLDAPRSVPRVALIVLSALQAAGIYFSELAVSTHISIKFSGGRDSGICAMDQFSCAGAAKSVYSELFGLPIAVLGEAYYLCALLWVVACALLLKPHRLQAGLSLLGGAISLSVLYSVFLGVISLTVLQKLCPICIGLYAVNILSLVVIITAKAWRPRQWLPSLMTSLSWKLALVMGLSLVGSQSIYAVRAKSAHKIAAKKRRRAEPPKYVEVALNGAPVRGDTKEALIIEFSDFQCPFCRRFSKYLKEASEESAGERPFSYAFRHFPLSPRCNPYIKRDMHPNACQAAVAGICAQAQGRFWELHDILFDNQHSLDEDDLLTYAEKVGLNMEDFKTCLRSDEARARLDKDIQDAHQYGIPATPAFFVNGWKHLGAKPPRVIKRAVAKYAYDVEVEEPSSGSKSGSKSGAQR